MTVGSQVSTLRHLENSNVARFWDDYYEFEKHTFNGPTTVAAAFSVSNKRNALRTHRQFCMGNCVFSCFQQIFGEIETFAELCPFLGIKWHSLYFDSFCFTLVQGNKQAQNSSPLPASRLLKTFAI
jgi:hypothetical protein